MITEGLLLRHCQDQRMFRDAALIDIAQDHVLHASHRESAGCADGRDPHFRLSRKFIRLIGQVTGFLSNMP